MLVGCVSWLYGVIQWTLSTFVSATPCTDMRHSLELEREPGTTAKARNLPRLEILAIFLKRN